MRILLLVFATYLAAVAETTLVDALRVGHVAPDLLALMAMLWLLSVRGPSAFLAAGGVALVSDLVAPGRVGVGAAWMLLVGYAILRLRSRFPLEHLAWQVLVTCAGVTAWAAAVGLSGGLLGDVATGWMSILSRAGGVGLYTAGLALPVLMVLGWARNPGPSRRLTAAGVAPHGRGG